MTITSIIAAGLSIFAVILLALATLTTRGAEVGVSTNPSLFKTGNPGLDGTRPKRNVESLS